MIPPHETSPPILEVDVAKYQSYLNDINIPEDQKLEFLEALWSIVTTFVDLGFGIHPVQSAFLDQQSNNKNKTPQTETEKEDA